MNQGNNNLNLITVALAHQEKIQTIPTFILYIDGEQAMREAGEMTEEFSVESFAMSKIIIIFVLVIFQIKQRLPNFDC